ncbi:MFS transporter [Pilimelia anulata]|uniref:MFS transporter n=1 Tax=Pilimelia anulata TaxID=53371 RepID=A0A8J3BDV9_9ACTN|nr:MFS transporter [Pilimelia anulata]GGK03321.1 MFS transporter [Pilimelia anulata]
MPQRRAERAVFVVLAVATGAFSVLQSLVVPALGTFRHALDTTPAGAAWILTAYLLSASVLTPIIGRFGDLYGRKWLLVAALGGLCAGSITSALADNLALMLAGRVVQGAGGAVFPLSFAIVRDHVAPDRRPRAIGALSAVLSVGGALGTVAAGPILDHLSYHWLFWIPAGVTAAAAATAAVLVPRSPVDRGGARVGWAGALLLASWLTLLLLAISTVGRADWRSPAAAGLAAGAAALFAVWLRVEARARHPLVDLRTLWLPTVRATNAATLLLGLGSFGAWMVVPLLVQQPAGTGVGFGATPTVVGLVMLPTAVGNVLVMRWGGSTTNRRGPRVTLLAGTALSGAAYLLLAAGHHHLPAVCAAVLLMGGGVGLAFAAVAVLVVEAVPADQTGLATGINTIMRTIGGTLGSTVAGSLLTAALTPAGYPHDGAYLAAFLLFAAALAGSFLVGTRVPTRPVPGAAAPAALAGLTPAR